MRPTWSLVLALQFARAEKSEGSRRAYRSDFELFSRWRERNWDPTFSTSKHSSLHFGEGSALWISSHGTE